ncbi:hypothetical protein Metho_2713 (plasmid) [Methanomethylovorans hollandica DSM 15978]|uniref:Uncharacterized protein n=1 Tax=Methanomethylovorans hollandica (strain DSM 15978 / NBRC 107637 / DMS1) TaxID=867904 RepID=L0L0J0_METHD|nr:hypothetical protein [Methanomethylovorans hollandica]AGB50841.1 hypothetical protein Metho_2713 [Methanomethylovorans hollandica DSM 15978]
MSSMYCIATITPLEGESIEEIESRVNRYLENNNFASSSRYTSSPYDGFTIETGKTTIITEELYDSELSEYEGECDGIELIGFVLSCTVFTDIDGEECTREFIGNKYAVFVSCSM